MEDPMTIIRRGLGVATPATQTLGLTGLGTLASEQMQTNVNERRKGIRPGPEDAQAYGSSAVATLFG